MAIRSRPRAASTTCARGTKAPRRNGRRRRRRRRRRDDDRDHRDRRSRDDDDDDDDDGEGGGVRNLGKTVQLAARYHVEGADKIAFPEHHELFRSRSSRSRPSPSSCRSRPGGGIRRSYTDPDSGVEYSALGGRRAGTSGRAPTRVGIGSDAVAAAEEHVRSGGVETGSTSIETISRV
jgi:glutamine amidotransferase/cyclase